MCLGEEGEHKKRLRHFIITREEPEKNRSWKNGEKTSAKDLPLF